MSYIFKEGDIVSFGGIEGVVSIDKQDSKFPIVVRFKSSGRMETFKEDGKLWGHHTEPLLKLVKEAKKKVRVYPALYYSNIHGFYVTQKVYSSEETAKKSCPWTEKFIEWPYTPGETLVEI